MPAFQINDEEREALRGLPMLAREIYVFGLRPFMDYVTGMVGVRRGISWKSIAEELYVEPHQGIDSGEPTEKQLRRAAVWLQKAGLISENQGERRLIFELPKASRDQSVRNKVGSKWADQAGRYPGSSEPSNHAGLPEEEGGEAGGCKTQKVGTPPVSGISPPPPSRVRACDSIRQRFAMTPDWEPDPKSFSSVLAMNGLAGTDIDQDQLAEFRSFWTASPDEQRTQAKWEHALAQQLKREHRYAQAANGRHTQACQRPDRQRRLSVVDRVREANAAAEAARQAAGEALAEDGGDVRPPLDGEFWRES